MSKHNNNLMPSSAGRCKCGRWMTIGESRIISGFNYECPDCFHHRVSKPITAEEFYKSFNFPSPKIKQHDH